MGEEGEKKSSLDSTAMLIERNQKEDEDERSERARAGASGGGRSFGIRFCFNGQLSFFAAVFNP